MSIPNTISVADTQFWAKEIEKILADMESAKGSYMAECKRQREMIKAKYEAANNAGVPTYALKKTLKIKALEAKIHEIIAEAQDDDQAETVEQVAAALGVFSELPLGRAALDAVIDASPTKKEAHRKSPLDVLTGQTSSDEALWDRAAIENTERLQAGIRELDAEAVH